MIHEEKVDAAYEILCANQAQIALERAIGKYNPRLPRPKKEDEHDKR